MSVSRLYQKYLNLKSKTSQYFCIEIVWKLPALWKVGLSICRFLDAKIIKSFVISPIAKELNENKVNSD